MDPVKIGLVGYGFGGRYFHAPLLAAAPECELLGVVTTSAERRDLVRAEHPGVDVFDSLAALAAAGAEAVSISTPAETHSALTDEAIELGLSVVCDKPFSMDPAAARRSVALAASRGVTLSPYQNRRWDSDFLTVRALVDDGTLGEVRRLESRFERYAPQNGPGRSGGGTLLDFGAHLVDQALTLLGPVESVYAESRPRDNGLDDDVFVALRHENGALSHLWGSWSQYAAGPRFRVTGTAASLVVTTADTQEDVLITGARPSAARAVGRGAGLGPGPGLHRGGLATGLPGERRLGHLLPDVRPSGTRRGPATGRGDRRRRDRRRAGGRPRQRRAPGDGAPGGRPVTGRELLDELEAQEARLVFDHFDDDVAWSLGVALREAATAAGLPVAISIRRNGQRLFHAALAGSSADNDAWLARKSAVVDRYGRSSLRVGEQFRVHGGTFDHDSRLDAATYAAHGGAFPIIVRGTGCVGTVAVSGLPEVEDHQFLVATLEAFLADRR